MRLGSSLTPDELAQIAACVNELKISAAGSDYKLIRQNIEQLDKATRRFAELMMDSEVMSAMKGQTMDAADESMGADLTARTPSPRPSSKRNPWPRKRLTPINTDGTD